jgi:hypothetical protein
MTTKRSEITADLCQFPFADGRFCRMLRSKDHPSLCLFHAREEEQLQQSKDLGAELAASFTGKFLTAADVNFVLGKLFTALAQKRVSQRDAATLAYIAQLMLHSLPSVKRETQFVYSYEAWEKMIDEGIPLSESWPTWEPATACPEK